MRVLLAFRNAGEWRERFRRALPGAAIEVWPEASAEVDYAIVWKPLPEVFERTRITGAVFNLGAGVDRLLAIPALRRPVPVYRLEDAGMAEQMCEYVAAATLWAYRDLDAYAEAQRAGEWKPLARRDKADFVVGLLGLGVLGAAVARTLAGLGFPLAAWTRTRRDVAGIATHAGPGELPAFLARCRVLVVLLPLTPETRGLVDRRLLGLLPRGAHLVNVARGDIVVDADLIAALADGTLAAATLDVFRDEPLPPAHPFWRHPRIRLTPHVSAATLPDASVAQIAGKIAQLARGETPSGRVDVVRGY
ncbi:MAG: 2-hydroxyacid dehydrogenase [Candidatus Levyibacteriota bacterium]